MNFIDIILLAVALGIDCLVVSFSQGLVFNNQRLVTALKLAVVMGLFQGFMPILGYMGMDKLYKYIVPHDRWIIFGIFLILGLKLIFEAYKGKMTNVKQVGFFYLITLGIATSMDALVAGAPLRIAGLDIVLPCYIIGITSFLMSLLGFGLGNKIKTHCPKCLGISGGVILIILAIEAII